MDHEWMTDRRDRNRDRQGLRAAVSRFAVVGVLAAGLGACASGPSSSVFVDPATYELYNCQQLGAARKRSNDRVVELEGLMAKAETGAGGSLVSGLAYQTDYLSERARRDQIDEKSPATIAAGPISRRPPSRPRRLFIRRSGVRHRASNDHDKRQS